MTVKTFIANPNGVSIEQDAIIYGDYTPLGRLQYVQLATSPNLTPYISTDAASKPGLVRWVINTTAPVQGPSWVNFSIQNYDPGPFVNNIVYPQDFGAVGDGIADDTAAIQGAVNAASMVSGTVYFPPGIYMVNGSQLSNSDTQRCSVFINSGSVAIEMAPGAIVRLLDGEYVDDGKSWTMFDGGGASTFTFTNIHLDGNGQNQSFTNSTTQTFFTGVALAYNNGNTNDAIIVCNGTCTFDNFTMTGSTAGGGPQGIGLNTFGCSTGIVDTIVSNNTDVTLWHTVAFTSTPTSWTVGTIISLNGNNSVVIFEGVGSINIGTVVNYAPTLPTTAGAVTLRMLATTAITNVEIGSTVTINGSYPIDGGAGGSAAISNTVIGRSLAVGCRGSYSLQNFDSSCQLGPFVAENCALGGAGISVFASFEVAGNTPDRVIGHDWTAINSHEAPYQFEGACTLRGGSMKGSAYPLAFNSPAIEATCDISDVVGYNPVGLVTVTVPASGTATAALPYDATFYVTASTSTVACAVTDAGGTSQIVATIPASGFAGVFVPAGSTLTPTYTAAPTWTVQGH